MEIALPAMTGAPRRDRTTATASAAARYDDGAVRQFTLAAVVWGIVGMRSACSSPPSWPGPSSTSASRG